jgi:hypothetical protein
MRHTSGTFSCLWEGEEMTGGKTRLKHHPEETFALSSFHLVHGRLDIGAFRDDILRGSLKT